MKPRGKFYIPKEKIGIMDIDKYLIIGSGYGIKEWYDHAGRLFIGDGYKLAAINNAWAIDGINLSYWFYATDFRETGFIHPDGTTKIPQDCKKISNEKDAGEYTGPYKYELGSTSGTMFLNTLYYFLNKAVKTVKSCEILVAGCDMDYEIPEGEDRNTHFYGTGRPDPLRAGIEPLKAELEKVHKLFIKHSCNVINVSRNKRTLLPFKRVPV